MGCLRKCSVQTSAPYTGHTCFTASETACNMAPRTPAQLRRMTYKCCQFNIARGRVLFWDAIRFVSIVDFVGFPFSIQAHETQSPAQASLMKTAYPFTLQPLYFPVCPTMQMWNLTAHASNLQRSHRCSVAASLFWPKLEMTAIFFMTRNPLRRQS